MGARGDVVAVAVAARGWHLRALRSTASRLGTTDGPLVGREHVGAESRRRRVRGRVVWSLRYVEERTERGGGSRCQTSRGPKGGEVAAADPTGLLRPTTLPSPAK